MRFSKQFGVTHTPQTPWFDPLLNQDTPLHVDAFLVLEDTDAHWQGAEQEAVDLFDTASLLIELEQDGCANVRTRRSVCRMTGGGAV